MFAGHLGAALIAKRLAPPVPLSTLVFCALATDFLWAALVILGVERYSIDRSTHGLLAQVNEYMPYSHGLLPAAGLALLIAGAVLRQRGARAALVVAAAVLSHWLLDWVVHTPDLTLYLGSEKLGLGLWRWTVPGTLTELSLVAAGFLLYRSITVPERMSGTWALIAMIGFLAALQMWLPFAPPSTREGVEWQVMGQVIFVFWAAAIERRRALRRPLAARAPAA
jgi:hypothetical protein